MLHISGVARMATAGGWEEKGGVGHEDRLAK